MIGIESHFIPTLTNHPGLKLSALRVRNTHEVTDSRGLLAELGKRHSKHHSRFVLPVAVSLRYPHRALPAYRFAIQLSLQAPHELAPSVAVLKRSVLRTVDDSTGVIFQGVVEADNVVLSDLHARLFYRVGWKCLQMKKDADS